ncbi:PaaI family thioesterase [Roseibium sp. RKSG952]|uniref:PaaI family thioesterase n=1 Tax=Roseibium sp. RKSG952 TaxID=2529384 RepID=UPI0012BD4E07|nr:PaaI family thioesterase [Roseibium sp. RKSG952]MTH95915.1 PaaI family thioesterase [Roseibium sp. RKSG952]
MENTVTLRQRPIGEFNKHVGLELTKWQPDYACVEVEIESHHTNVMGITHGGMLVSALDFACGMSGCFRAPPEPKVYCMTLTLNTNFIAPMGEGLLQAHGRRVGGGRSVFFAQGDITLPDGTLIATASGAFRLLDRKPKA